jgi:hypothetical protein
VSTASPVAVPEPVVADALLGAGVAVAVDGAAAVDAVAVCTAGGLRVEGEDAGRAGDGRAEDDGGSAHPGLRFRT